MPAAGLGCVAVFSEADAAAPHAAEADAAVRLPGSSPAQTYLNGPAIVAAAITAGADAVHPGYGFLAEDAGFARAVVAAGLTWVGPPADAIEAMGSKIRSKKLAAGAAYRYCPCSIRKRSPPSRCWSRPLAGAGDAACGSSPRGS